MSKETNCMTAPSRPSQRCEASIESHPPASKGGSNCWPFRHSSARPMLVANADRFRHPDQPRPDEAIPDQPHSSSSSS